MAVRFSTVLEIIRRFVIAATGLPEMGVLEYNYAGEDINASDFPAVRFALQNLGPLYDNCADGYVHALVYVYDASVDTSRVWSIIELIWNTEEALVTLSDSSQRRVRVIQKDLIPLSPAAQDIFQGGVSLRLHVPNLLQTA